MSYWFISKHNITHDENELFTYNVKKEVNGPLQSPEYQRLYTEFTGPSQNK